MRVLWRALAGVFGVLCLVCASTAAALRHGENSRTLDVHVLPPAIVEPGIAAPAWTVGFTPDKSHIFGPQLITHDATSFYIRDDSHVVALDASGRKRWSSEQSVSWPLLVRGTSVYGTYFDGSVRVFEATDGRERWSKKLAHERPVLRLSNDGFYVGDTSDPCCGYAELDAFGNERWRAHVRLLDPHGTTFVTFGHIFEIGRQYAYGLAPAPLFAFDRVRGKLAWEHPLCSTPFTVLNDVTYCRNVSTTYPEKPWVALRLDRNDVASGASRDQFVYSPDPEYHFQEVGSPSTRKAAIEGFYLYFEAGGTIYRYDLRRAPARQQPVNLPRSYPSFRWVGGPHNGWLYIEDQQGLWAYKIRAHDAVARLLLPTGHSIVKDVRFDGDVAIAEVFQGNAAIFDARDPDRVLLAHTPCKFFYDVAATDSVVAFVCFDQRVSQLVVGVPRKR